MEQLLTQDEAIKILRLDARGLKCPKEALRHLRRMGKLGFLKIGRSILIPESALEAYIKANEVRANA